MPEIFVKESAKSRLTNTLWLQKYVYYFIQQTKTRQFCIKNQSKSPQAYILLNFIDYLWVFVRRSGFWMRNLGDVKVPHLACKV